MQIQSFEMKGLTVFKKPQKVDFGEMPAGLVAVVGPNGGGKSTLLEAIFATLYRAMPTHGTLPQNCHGRDAKLRLSFTMSDHRFEATILVDAVSNKQEAYLLMDGSPIVNGKLGEFDKAIASIVGTERMTLSSTFNSQTRKGSFIGLDVAERKSLFIEMLGLGNYPVMEERAKSLHADALLESVHLNGQRGALQERVREGEALREAAMLTWEKAHAARVEAALADGFRLEKAGRLSELEQALAGETQLKQRAVEVDTQIALSSARRTELQGKLAGLTAALQVERAQLDIALTATERRIAVAKALLQGTVELLGRREEISIAVSRRLELHDNATALAVEYEDALQAERYVEGKNRERMGLDHATELVKSSIALCERETEELASIPCHGKEPYASCPKITRSIESRDRLPDLRDQLRSLLLTRDGMVIARRGRALDVIQQESRLATAEYQATDEYLALNAAASQAATRKDELTASILAEEAIRDSIINKMGEDTATDPLAGSYIQRIEEECAAYYEAHQQRTKIATALAALRPKAIDAATLRTQIATLESEARTHLSAAAGLEATVRGIEERLLGVAKAEEELLVIDQKKMELDWDVADWHLLALAFGKNGIPALEIDAAGPGVSALANDLLSSCFGNRFSLDLKTQRLSADGKKLIEDFDIRVIDSEQGRDGTIDSLSGGEKVIVNEAVGMAIGLYMKSERHFQTLFRDETDGALDAAHAPRYVEMLRRALKLGSYSQCLFVTHRQECAELADARIRCEGGTVAVEF